jgi:hypothetical protein
MTIKKLESPTKNPKWLKKYLFNNICRVSKVLQNGISIIEIGAFLGLVCGCPKVAS